MNVQSLLQKAHLCLHAFQTHRICFQDGKKRVREDAKDAKEGDNNETIEEEPPKKKIPKVTKIGGDLTSIAPLSFNVGTLSGPKMEKFVPPPRRPESLITPPKSEKNASTPLAGNSRLMEWNDGGKETQLSQNEGSNGNESSESKQKKVQETQRISESKKSAKERKASQQALDRRHNERILAGSLYQDPDEPTKVLFLLSSLYFIACQVTLRM